MDLFSRCLVHHAQELARETAAKAVVLYADNVRDDEEFRRMLEALDFPAIFVTHSKQFPIPPGLRSHVWLPVPDVPMTRAGQVQAALLTCLARGVLKVGDRVICLVGAAHSHSIDTLLLISLGSESELFSMLDSINFAGDVAPEVFERTLTLAGQLAVEGREGRPVGVLFVVGDSDRVLAQSRSLVLNPFQGHPMAERNILDPALAETIKEYAALDGAFVIRGDGVVLTAGTLLVPTAAHAPLPGGLGARHAAAAGITASSAALAICVSQSTGTVSVFKSGRLVTTFQRPEVTARPSAS